MEEAQPGASPLAKAEEFSKKLQEHRGALTKNQLKKQRQKRARLFSKAGGAPQHSGAVSGSAGDFSIGTDEPPEEAGAGLRRVRLKRHASATPCSSGGAGCAGAGAARAAAGSLQVLLSPGASSGNGSLTHYEKWRLRKQQRRMEHELRRQERKAAAAAQQQQPYQQCSMDASVTRAATPGAAEVSAVMSLPAGAGSAAEAMHVAAAAVAAAAPQAASGAMQQPPVVQGLQRPTPRQGPQSGGWGGHADLSSIARLLLHAAPTLEPAHQEQQRQQGEPRPGVQQLASAEAAQRTQATAGAAAAEAAGAAAAAPVGHEGHDQQQAGSGAAGAQEEASQALEEVYEALSPGEQQQRQQRRQGCWGGRQVQPQPCRTNLSGELVLLSQEMSADLGQQQGQQRQGQGQRQQGQGQQQLSRRRRNHYPWGNYPRYYGYRLGHGHHDPRIKALDPSWLAGADMLDIGCNEGLITLAFVTQLGARSALGIDIDAGLVRKAGANLRRARASLAAEMRQLARHEGPGQGRSWAPLTRASKALSRTSFRAGDWLEMPAPRDKYDVVTCLSVTKWVHLNCGDDGLMKLFNKVYRSLTPGGLFILEPQPWRSYKSAVHKQDLSGVPYSHYESLKLRPGGFIDYLTQRVGFELLAKLAPAALAGIVGAAGDGGADQQGGEAEAGEGMATATAAAAAAAEQMPDDDGEEEGGGGRGSGKAGVAAAGGGEGEAGGKPAKAPAGGWNRRMLVFRKPAPPGAAVRGGPATVPAPAAADAGDGGGTAAVAAPGSGGKRRRGGRGGSGSTPSASQGSWLSAQGPSTLSSRLLMGE